MAKIYLLLGSNLGNRMIYLERARQKITRLIGHPEAVSSVFETEPWGFTHQTNFLNQLVIAVTPLQPDEAMEKIHRIEQQLGRTREDKQFTARIIDIDILFYDKKIITTGNLVIPHPLLEKRRFALEPLAEVEPGLVHPVHKKTVARLLEECDDRMKVNKL